MGAEFGCGITVKATPLRWESELETGKHNGQSHADNRKMISNVVDPPGIELVMSEKVPKEG